MNTKSCFRWLLFVTMLISPSYLMALTANNGQNISVYDNDEFSLGFGLEASYLSGTTREKVYMVGYETGHDAKISELEWQLDDVIMVGGVVSGCLNKRFYLNAGYWSKMTAGDGYLDDTDWSYMTYYYYYYTQTVVPIETVLYDDNDNPIYYIDEDGNVYPSTSVTAYDDGDGNVYVRVDDLYAVVEDLRMLRTHYSKSSASLEKGRMFDINFAMTLLSWDENEFSSMFPSLKDSKMNVNGIIGYKSDEWKWEATGGYYMYNLYSSELYGYDMSSFGRFDDVTVISYEQDLKVPYIGASIDIEGRKLGFGAYFLWSKWAEASDNDIHVLRDLQFKDKFDDGVYTSFGMNLKWDITNNFSVSGSYQWENLHNVRGDMYVIDLTDNSSVMYPAAAGLSHNNNSFSISGIYKYS